MVFTPPLGAAGSKESRALGPGDYLPDLTFNVRLSREDAMYLGIATESPVAIAKIDKDLLVIELFITQCFKCQKQAPVYEEALEAISSDPSIKDKVAFIGIAIGNTDVSTEKYRQAYSVSFPLLPDDSLAAYKKMGEPGKAPHTIFARRTEDGRKMVISVHGGPFYSAGDLVDEIRATLQYDLQILRGESIRRQPVIPLESAISGEEVSRLITESVDTLAGKTRRVEAVELRSGNSVYVVTAGYGNGRRKLFAKAESRKSICGDCHDSHFIYVFDGAGKIIDFIPIRLAKMGNLDWNSDDVEFAKDRLLGRSILGNIEFHAEIDAVTGATITSILIFDSMRAGRELYEELVAEGYIKPADKPTGGKEQSVKQRDP